MTATPLESSNQSKNHCRHRTVSQQGQTTMTATATLLDFTSQSQITAGHGRLIWASQSGLPPRTPEQEI